MLYVNRSFNDVNNLLFIITVFMFSNDGNLKQMFVEGFRNVIAVFFIFIFIFSCFPMMVRAHFKNLVFGRFVIANVLKPALSSSNLEFDYHMCCNRFSIPTILFL